MCYLLVWSCYFFLSFLCFFLVFAKILFSFQRLCLVMSALNNPNALKIKSVTFSTGIWKTKKQTKQKKKSNGKANADGESRPDRSRLVELPQDGKKKNNNRVLCKPSSVTHATFSKHQTTANLNQLRRTNAYEDHLRPTWMFALVAHTENV